MGRKHLGRKFLNGCDTNKTMDRAAIIDLGTNTFNLLIIEKHQDKSYTNIYNTKVGVGLGFGGINDNIIADKAMNRALETLAVYKNKCDELRVNNIYAFGTSAIRNANNKDVFLKRVKEDIGISIKVISGLEEAEFIYKGVSLGHDFHQQAIIMDIGGGSTEFIVANNEGMQVARSFEIGVARIFQKLAFNDPLSPANCAKIEEYLEAETNGFFEQFNLDELIGASGSFETFYELIKNTDYPTNQFVKLSREEMEKSLDLVINSTQKERDENPRIIPIRKKMAPIAAVKIRWIIRKLNIKTIVISPFSLKEGVISLVFS